MRCPNALNSPTNHLQHTWPTPGRCRLKASRLLPAAGAAAADLAAVTPALVQLQGRSSPIKLTRRTKPIAWHRWEYRLYQQLVQLEEDNALLGAPDSDEWYFSYWDCPDSHLAVLQDDAYQTAWTQAITAAAHLIKDAVVLDVGCGLGTLAMMAAKAGAKHVYAVDASPGAAELARKVIAANGLSNKITVITGRAEQVSLPVRNVDVIVSDWMGSMLLHEGLLGPLIRVRDRWLSPDGIILPDMARLHVVGVDDRQYLAEQSKLWGGQPMGPGDGFDMKAVLNAVVKHPRVDTVSRRAQLVTDTQQLLSIDLYKVRLQHLTFKTPFTLTAQQAGRVSGLLTYIDTAFTCRGKLKPNIAVPTFTTSPTKPSTSWLQLFFSFPRAIKLELGQQLTGSFGIDSAGVPYGRMLNVDVDIEFQGLKAHAAYQLKR